MTALPHHNLPPEAPESAAAQSPDLSAWLTVEVAARRLGVSPRQVRRRCEGEWSDAGLARRVDGLWRIDPAADPALEDAAATPPLLIREDFKALAPAQQTQAMQRAECVRRLRRAKMERCGKVADWLPGLLAELQDAYPDLRVSRASLYRWDKRAGHPPDVMELVDWRGHANAERGGSGEVTAWTYFASIYLDSAARALRDCWRETAAWAEARGVDWCSVDSCRRQLDTRINPERQAYHRDRALWKSKFAPYTEQHPERHAAGECWVADHRPLDIFCRFEGEVIRPVLTRWQDWRTRKTVGWELSASPNTDTILAALGMAVRDPANLGPPRYAWMDNGKDFDSFAVKGYGKRERQRRRMKIDIDKTWFGGVLGALGIEPRFSLPHNPKGKARCERSFATDAIQFDRRWATYTGKDTTRKPHDLGERMRLHADRIVPSFAEVKAALAEHIAALNARADHQIEDLRDPETRVKLSPDDAYAAWATPSVLADPAALDLCLMPHTRPVTVTRNGVRLALPGCPPRYYGQYADELRPWKGSGRKVYLAYDPADTRQVQVRDEHLRLICIAPLNENTGVYDAPESRDALKAAQRAKRNYEKGVRLERENRDAAYMPDDWLVGREAERIEARKKQDDQPTRVEPDPDRPLKLVQTPFDGQSKDVERERAQLAAGAESMAGEADPLDLIGGGVRIEQDDDDEADPIGSLGLIDGTAPPDDGAGETDGDENTDTDTDVDIWSHLR